MEIIHKRSDCLAFSACVVFPPFDVIKWAHTYIYVLYVMHCDTNVHK